MHPLSVRDLIWLRTASYLRRKYHAENEVELFKSKMKMMQNIYLAVADCRELLTDIDFHTRAAAFKGTKIKLEPFDVKMLPSSREEAAREAEEEKKRRKERKERRKAMTDKERAAEDLKDLLAGKIITPDY